MDPVSAIGVAAAVVQFADYGKRLVTRGLEIRKSPNGRTKKEQEALSSLSDLRRLASQAQGTLGRYSEAQWDEDLSLVYEDVETVSQEFDVLLQSIGSRSKAKHNGGKGQLFKSLGSAVDSLHDEDAVRVLLNRLDNVRSRGISFTLSALWQASKESSEREARFGDLLNEAVQRLRQLDNIKDTYSEQIIGVLNEDKYSATATIYDELIDTLWNRKRKPATHQVMAPSGLNASVFCKAITEKLVSGLHDHMDDREQSIAQIYEGTFPWIFRRDAERWSSFPEWLEKDTNTPYWISGKPGSGKSTLMKYILQQPELRKSLEIWAAGSPLCIASFYAWLAGSDFQKSLTGFMQTILFQALQAYTDLIPRVAPRRWALFATLRASKKQPSWQDWEIEESFEALLTEFSKHSPRRMAVFIDGLDEFKETSERVMKLVLNVCNCGGIKLCVASRQWTEFNDALERHPMIRMQDVTEHDMLVFALGNLGVNRGFADLRKAFPLDAVALVQELVDKANGVFLWSDLVVQKLLRALSEGDGLPQLGIVLKSLPDDLDRLYTTIWDSIRGPKSASAELISLKLAADPQLHYVNLWLADGGFATARGLNTRDLPEDAKMGLRGTMVRRLDSKTRGLLELSPSDHVEFMHRTALDWVTRTDTWADISSYLPSSFDPNLNLLHANALSYSKNAHLHAGDSADAPSAVERSVHAVMRYAPEIVITHVPPEALEELIQALDGMDKTVRAALGPDWSYKTPQGLKCDFFGLVCRYGFIPYLNSKLASGAAPLEASSDREASPLENAIFGHRLTAPAEAVPYSQRIRTVAFLLNKGASPKRLRDARVRELRSSARSSAWSDRGEQKYWFEVRRLLGGKGVDTTSILHMIYERRDALAEEELQPAKVEYDGVKADVDGVQKRRRSLFSCFGCQ